MNDQKIHKKKKKNTVSYLFINMYKEKKKELLFRFTCMKSIFIYFHFLSESVIVSNQFY